MNPKAKGESSIAENYSAVELLKSARKDGYEMGVGDVGSRDRNIALKRCCILVGHRFSNLVKGLETAAQNLEKEDDEMTVDSELFEDEKREPHAEEPKKVP
ncbi:hypothetical protein GWN42_04205 [candidate division KSB1 bacterium]|nr:hypothetical protein [candidate division KSB1 bacterium]